MQITAPLSISNGAATPVAKSFAPERVSPEHSVFTERSSGVSAGFTKLTLKYSAANSRRNTNRVDLDIDFPILSTVNGVSTVAYVPRFKSYAVLPDQMTPAERADFAAYIANAFTVAVIRAMFKDLDPAY